MANGCDIHPENDLLYYLVGPDGNCYYMCSLGELRVLANSSGHGGELPTCGHTPDGKNERGTWWQGFDWTGIPPEPDVNTGVKGIRTSPLPTQAEAFALAPVLSPHERLRNALLEVLFCAMDLRAEDKSSPRYDRWLGWAVSWLREALNDTKR